MRRKSKNLISLLFITNTLPLSLLAQVESTINETKDSLYINEVEHTTGSVKVLHAEPLYIDLIRDLGARKGEKEWNIGLGMTDNTSFDQYNALVEYEWAPINRLGFEVELPFTFYYPTSNDITPKSQLNALKLATQYSFFVSEKMKTSMAFGYIHEFEFAPIANPNYKNFYLGNVFNPFFVAAKRWGNNFHTLVYTGPSWIQHFSSHQQTALSWNFNTSFHYMISGTRNFIGVEFNKYYQNGDFDMTIRPQMRVGISENLLIGIVTGIPIVREQERFSTFFRLIYEPHGKKQGN